MNDNTVGFTIASIQVRIEKGIEKVYLVDQDCQTFEAVDLFDRILRLRRNEKSDYSVLLPSVHF
jgi:hypothetical protein